MISRSLCVCALTALGVTSAVWAGPDWVERGDAGSLLSDAQPVLGIGQLTTIQGSLRGASGRGSDSGRLVDGDFEDMYLIRILVPSTFSFTTSNANFNAQCFLFNITLPGQAFGLLASDDSMDSNQPRLVSPATDGTGAAVTLPGEYALAISGFGRDPISKSGRIFHFATPTEISGADGPGGLNPLTGWTGTGDTGSYLISVQGVGFADVPAPGAAVMAAGGLILLARRRR